MSTGARVGCILALAGDGGAHSGWWLCGGRAAVVAGVVRHQGLRVVVIAVVIER